MNDKTEKITRVEIQITRKEIHLHKDYLLDLPNNLVEVLEKCLRWEKEKWKRLNSKATIE